MSARTEAGEVFRLPKAIPIRSKSASATQLQFFIDFGTLQAPNFKIFYVNSPIFNASVGSFGQFLCFNLPSFTSQHPKVSAVALRLQSNLGATLSAQKAPETEYPEWRGASWCRPGRDLRPQTIQNHIFIDSPTIWDRFFHRFYCF